MQAYNFIIEEWKEPDVQGWLFHRDRFQDGYSSAMLKMVESIGKIQGNQFDGYFFTVPTLAAATLTTCDEVNEWLTLENKAIDLHEGLDLDDAVKFMAWYRDEVDARHDDALTQQWRELDEKKQLLTEEEYQRKWDAFVSKDAELACGRYVRKWLAYHFERAFKPSEYGNRCLNVFEQVELWEAFHKIEARAIEMRQAGLKLESGLLTFFDICEHVARKLNIDNLANMGSHQFHQALYLANGYEARTYWDAYFQARGVRVGKCPTVITNKEDELAAV